MPLARFQQERRIAARFEASSPVAAAAKGLRWARRSQTGMEAKVQRHSKVTVVCVIVSGLCLALSGCTSEGETSVSPRTPREATVAPSPDASVPPPPNQSAPTTGVPAKPSAPAEPQVCTYKGQSYSAGQRCSEKCATANSVETCHMRSCLAEGMVEEGGTCDRSSAGDNCPPGC